MTNEAIEALLTRLCDRLPALMIERGYNRDTCILHSRLAVDLLRAKGLRAAPLAVQLAVFNQAYARWTHELGRMPREGDDPASDIWAVHIGYGADPRAERPGFDGHVITTVNGRYAIDLTADQTSRPHKGIVTYPHWWIMDDGFARGGVHVFRTSSGAYMRYEAMPEERGFLKAGDWQLPGRASVWAVPTINEVTTAVA